MDNRLVLGLLKATTWKVILKALPNRGLRGWALQLLQREYWVSALSPRVNLPSRVKLLMETIAKAKRRSSCLSEESLCLRLQRLRD
jgi:hypothetical protein